MGRQRKHPTPEFLTVVAGSKEEALRRLQELHRLAQPTGGRPVRIDRLREAMNLADQIPPTPEKQCRKTRGTEKRQPTPRREARAAASLRDICAERGDHLTDDNATRVMEQAREIIDRGRGISDENRRAIEDARSIIKQALRAIDTRRSPNLTEREIAIVKRAAEIIQQASEISQRDQEFLEEAQQVPRWLIRNSRS